jgi:hypothetical protein
MYLYVITAIIVAIFNNIIILFLLFLLLLLLHYITATAVFLGIQNGIIIVLIMISRYLESFEDFEKSTESLCFSRYKVDYFLFVTLSNVLVNKYTILIEFKTCSTYIFFIDLSSVKYGLSNLKNMSDKIKNKYLVKTLLNCIGIQYRNILVNNVHSTVNTYYNTAMNREVTNFSSFSILLICIIYC